MENTQTVLSGRKNTKSKRFRYSKKQKAFLHSVLLGGKSVDTAVTDLRISARILSKWLQKPLFLRAIQAHLAGCRMLTRMAAAQQAPLSVDSMDTFVNSNDPEYARQACVDLLQTYSTYHHAYKKAGTVRRNEQRMRNDLFPKEQNVENQPVKKSQQLKRLTRKQKYFLNNIFDAGQIFEHALEDLAISHRMLYDWLQQPRFLHAIETCMARFHLQARIQSARSASHAIQSLSDLTSRSTKHEFVRKASMDLLKIHHALDTEKYSKHTAEKCAPTGQHGAPKALKCAPLRADGTKMCARARQNNGKINQKPDSQPKISVSADSASDRFTKNIKFPLALTRNSRFGQDDN